MTLSITDDVRIKKMEQVISPRIAFQDIPSTEKAVQTTEQSRRAIHNILTRRDDRLLIISGPCSIHDTYAALDYGSRLLEFKKQYEKDLLILMRVYFEKPRTTVGWKGMINDPDLNETFNINKGLRLSRKLLVDLNEMGMPAGTEYLDMITPQYIADLIAWGAIGARTTENQGHRELSSGLSCPVGFKNGTNGNLDIAVDAIRAARCSHSFLSVTKEGLSAKFTTTGNEDCHIILRGGKEPNYDADNVNEACKKLEKVGLPEQVMIDFSHANSYKKPANQLIVADNVAQQISSGDQRIMGVMIESHLKSGRQDVEYGVAKNYGQSITDACVDINTTEEILVMLAQAVSARRDK